jgi:hypothetical protein
MSGCQVPFVLRKSTDRRYEIVGEAYMDEILDGGAAKERKDVRTLDLISDVIFL